jgi:phosphocarrier protein
VAALHKKIKIQNPQGLHARPASIFVKIANKYEAEVTVKKGRQQVNGKSIMGLMMLAANQGSTVTIEVQGRDGAEALAELAAFLGRADEPKDTEGLT